MKRKAEHAEIWIGCSCGDGLDFLQHSSLQDFGIRYGVSSSMVYFHCYNRLLVAENVLSSSMHTLNISFQNTTVSPNRNIRGSTTTHLTIAVGEGEIAW